MGFNKKYVRPLSDVKEELEKYPENLRYYLKADCLIGSKESIDYIYDLAEKQDILKNSSSNQ
jgi:hypothetical protein